MENIADHSTNGPWKFLGPQKEKGEERKLRRKSRKDERKKEGRGEKEGQTMKENVKTEPRRKSLKFLLLERK